MQLVSSLFHSLPHMSKVSPGTQLIGPRLVLRMGDPTNWREWRNLREASQGFLVPWEPSWPHNALTYTFFCKLLRRQWREWRQGRNYAFLIFRHAPGKRDTLVGGISLNDVQRGIAQKGTLGYWIGEVYAKQGLMTEAVGLVCDFAFNTLRLHRVEASCLPRNDASQNLLRRLSFEEEGFAKSYLQINGKWEDHILWGRTNPSPTRSTLRTA
jgi:ribosomal-protein-alanine N-acetyltransferase